MSPARRAIGSVLPLETVDSQGSRDSIWDAWTRGCPGVAAFGSARAALAALLADRGIARLWLPAYACPALAAAGRSCELCWYGVDASLEPELPSLAGSLLAGDAVLVIAYFGRPPGEAIRLLAAGRPDVLWIEDRAQCIEPPGPAWSDVVLYSPRKLIGVGEGGVMVGAAPLPAPAAGFGAGSSEAQRARRLDPDGVHPQRWFSAFQAQEAAIAPDGSPMRAETRAVLEGVALAPRVAARRRNARILLEALPDLALWQDPAPSFTPLCVPIRIERRDEVAAALASRRIYCARHWSDLPGIPSRFPQAQLLSAQLLSLPCDHTCGASEMRRIIVALRDAGARRAHDRHPSGSPAGTGRRVQ